MTDAGPSLTELLAAALHANRDALDAVAFAPGHGGVVELHVSADRHRVSVTVRTVLRLRDLSARTPPA